MKNYGKNIRILSVIQSLDIYLYKPVKTLEHIQYLCFSPFFYVCREERNLNETLNMRIGIHSGKILSGLLGVHKWQYDIWSHDVIIASNMEQAGEPGLVTNIA
jgi:hypothetical protein